MPTFEDVSELFQQAQSNLLTAIKEAADPFWQDFEILDNRMRQLVPIAFYRAEAMEFLRERGLDTYEALEDRYRKVIELASIRDEKEVNRRFDEEFETNPIMKGMDGAILNVLDFMVAIPHVPQPPDASRPTVLGMFLSAIQRVTTNECYWIKPASDNLVMHPFLTVGTLLGMNSRTTDGRPVADLYTWDPPAASGTAVTPVSRPLTLEDFRIHNAVSFGPDRLLLTGELLTSGGESEPEQCEMINVQYNTFQRDQATFLVTQGVQMAKIDNMDDPGFMQALTKNILLGGHNR